MTARRGKGGKKGSGKPAPPEAESDTIGSKAKNPLKVRNEFHLVILQVALGHAFVCTCGRS
jgi:hypothetical protein